MAPADQYRFSLLAIAIWREGRGEPYEGKLAIGFVIRNRVAAQRAKAWGLDYDGVILHPKQFSSFNEDDPNSRKLPALFDASFLDCLRAAEAALDNKTVDNTGGSVFYYALSISPPAWASAYIHTVDIGNHRFYKEK